MDLGLKGKSVFVAAASKGLGRATALEFAREGANVTIASRSKEQLSEAKRMIGEQTGTAVTAAVMDVRSEEEVRRAIAEAAQRFGGLDVLVCNAGGPPGGGFGDMSDEDWQSAFELNLLSTIRMIREALPYMRRAGEGRIVNVTSVSIKQPVDGLILSNVFRAGVQALTKSLASELAADRILINTVAPGQIATDRIRELDEDRAKKLGRPVETVREDNVKQIPLGRLGEPDEFGRIAAFYGSFANTYVTGQSLLVDGGMVKAL
ncbi:SDR family oxidoreductase [Saccharibacillus sp. CPCC 101409]|uniref:SDR family oxidoreductase n=1 Tax=Saccharibacillus sp. CPCC 101409 TaxID=3058041 RepID=UPI0026728696|nr:SDR family oxidoreductase [Saccharibacillus sp. CPCC 101409]MDO3411937.1 SDR family oxidoreductase [Saccharibacillus sp. CPCC 101409]